MTETPTTKQRPKPPTNGGRPPGARSFRTKAARMADASLRLLGEVQEDPEAPYMARVLAAQTILGLAGMPLPAKAAKD